MQRLQALPRRQRLLIFILLFAGGLFLILAVSAVLLLQALNATPRSQATAMVSSVTVAPCVRDKSQPTPTPAQDSEHCIVLPDDDAYPASVAVAPNGTVYVGSYVTGAIWSVDASGTIQEMPNSRKVLGAVAGMTAVPDGTLYIVDRLRTDLGAHGGAILHATSDGVISAFATIGDSRGFVDPDDITLDSQGRVYVSDWGRNEVWRFDADGKNGVAWWTSPVVEGAKRYAPTGLAYDAQHDAILITDPEVNSIYRVPVADATKTETLYRHGDKPDAPGFDGITVTAKGDIYVVALGLNKLAKLNNGALEYLVQGFRGGSDVDSFTLPDGTVRLYVPNWDQLGLLLQAYQPHLPFAVDVITVRG